MSRLCIRSLRDHAKALAYLYGACDRSVFHPRIGTPSEALFADRFSGTSYPLARDRLASLCDITIANELEIAGRSAAFRAAHGVALMSLFKRMAGRASEPALQAAQSLLGHSPP